LRVKTDTRRQAIIIAAWQVFKDGSFERTTMSDISERVGGSKATLYSYFKSKDDLFAAAMAHALREKLDDAFERVSAAGDLGDRLREFAHAYLNMRLSRDMVGADRALIASADRSELGAVLHAKLITPHWRRLATVMTEEMEAGSLRKGDPLLAAIHFRGLIEADLLERALHGASVTSEEVAAAIEEGVAAFLRAYAPGSK
jgi:AcrR family transcriptional regulator